MLTAEYVDACKVDDVEDLRHRGLDVADVSLQYHAPLRYWILLVERRHTFVVWSYVTLLQATMNI